MLSSICTSVKQRFYSRISVTKQILEEDKLLFFPFDSMDTFIELLKESAKDKETLSIKDHHLSFGKAGKDRQISM